MMLNLLLRFLLELALLAAVGYWGFQTNTGVLAWVLGLGAPIGVALIWGIWVAPQSKRKLADPLRLGVEIILFGLGVLALWVAQQPTAALIFALLVIINLILLQLWRQR
ncbi:MAG: YrdB family protein [Anaerolineae bacterium]|nr:YrdB family protein [Anaerolineae bacterium]